MAKTLVYYIYAALEKTRKKIETLTTNVKYMWT
jgi:hypothetical protein